ncbi:50S ribosomal protein L33 [Candidatus Parcubacteria bacterium]|nr:50S ribosomal protein L33 [Candidatus Parcubacteria bacterium]
MAKKTARILLHLECKECGSQNYITEKNKLNTKGKLNLKKYCKRCRKHTPHKENPKMK